MMGVHTLQNPYVCIGPSLVQCLLNPSEANQRTRVGCHHHDHGYRSAWTLLSPGVVMSSEEHNTVRISSGSFRMGRRINRTRHQGHVTSNSPKRRVQPALGPLECSKQGWSRHLVPADHTIGMPPSSRKTASNIILVVMISYEPALPRFLAAQALMCPGEGFCSVGNTHTDHPRDLLVCLQFRSVRALRASSNFNGEMSLRSATIRTWPSATDLVPHTILLLLLFSSISR